MGEIKLLNDVRGVVGCSLVGRVFVCSVLSNNKKPPYGLPIRRFDY